MQSPLAQKRLAGFDLVQTNYKTVGDHNIRADFIIPQSNYTGKRPVIIHFHGGGFLTGDALFFEWFPQYLFDIAKQHNAVIVSPNYRLLPEATTLDLFDDIEDFWIWLHSPAASELLSSQPNPTELDLDRIITAGESAGGTLSICHALAHPEEIRAATASFPGFLSAPVEDVSARKDPPRLSGLSLEEANRVVDEAIRDSEKGVVQSSITPPERLPLMLAIVEVARLYELYERGTEKDPRRALRHPMERLDEPDVKFPRGGISIRHGLEDDILPPEDSQAFVDKARKVMDGKPGGDKIVLALRPGGHGFESETTGDEEWLQENLRFAIEAWLE
ncbi:alpha/beta-hydrolase [Aspergillus costaricaensis CBS 115574]|uniref:Alpha/beta-hydrolase n=1 Tax=Aspergillus costaricaensis CBS 115574 TaxID=1448317 RepID=A0ACD1IPK8_9EURO|nr:alpha/beta-hydrolase [Aspergillus costaricaensis CBS 115574]RAK92509.1 alpha/beta-hydrolase [Aspergillus costaricaensis CBS 115574]